MKKVYIAVRGKVLAGKLSSVIENSYPIIKQNDIEVFNSLKECSEKLKIHTPDVLLLGMNLPGKNWVNFCNKIRKEHPFLKVLMVTSYEKYFEYKDDLENEELISGYISEDASAEAIVAGIETVMKKKPFNYTEFDSAAAEKDDEWIKPFLKELKKDFSAGYNDLEKIERLSQLIDFFNEYRRIIIDNLLAEELEKDEDRQNHKRMDELSAQRFEHLFVKGYNNWKIGYKLQLNNIEEIRKARMEFIRKIADKSSMIILPKMNDKAVELTDRELEVLNETAAGYTNEEIGNQLAISIETVKTHERNLREKFGVGNAMEMVIKALRLGIIKLDHIGKSSIRK